LRLRVPPSLSWRVPWARRHDLSGKKDSGE
jgi:hypothetical protein